MAMEYSQNGLGGIKPERQASSHREAFGGRIGAMDLQRGLAGLRAKPAEEKIYIPCGRMQCLLAPFLYKEDVLKPVSVSQTQDTMEGNRRHHNLKPHTDYCSGLVMMASIVCPNILTV